MNNMTMVVRSQKVRIILMLLAGVGLLSLWLAVVDIDEILALLSGFELKYVLLFTVLWAGAAFTRSQRWRVILAKVERVPAAESFGLFMSCMFINFLIPLRLGEAVTSYALKKSRGVPFARSLPTQVMDRLFDLTPVVPALVLSVFLMGGEGFGSLIAILGFVALVFSLLTGMFVLSMARPRKATGIIRALAKILPRAIRGRVEDFGVLCMEGLGGLRLAWTTIAMLVGMTFLALALDAASLGVIFLGLGHAVSPAVVIVGYTFLFLTSALPRPPGLVGSHEVLFLLIFSLLLGVDRHLAGAAVVAGHLMLALLLTVTGSLSLFGVGIRSVSAVRDHLSTATTTGTS